MWLIIEKNYVYIRLVNVNYNYFFPIPDAVIIHEHLFVSDWTPIKILSL